MKNFGQACRWSLAIDVATAAFAHSAAATIDFAVWALGPGWYLHLLFWKRYSDSIAGRFFASGILFAVAAARLFAADYFFLGRLFADGILFVGSARLFAADCFFVAARFFAAGILFAAHRFFGRFFAAGILFVVSARRLFGRFFVVGIVFGLAPTWHRLSRSCPDAP